MSKDKEDNKDKKPKDNVVQFPRPLSFDNDGLPNVPRATVYGVQCFHRGVLTGTMLFLEREMADNAQKLAHVRAIEAGQQRAYTFKREDYPVY